MADINVNEYVRTKHDGILKIRDIKEEEVFNTYYEMGRSYSYSEKKKFIYYRDDDMRVSIDDIKKHSKNIIDLIEVGDYVNGFKVGDVCEVPNKEIGKVIETDISGICGWEAEPVTIYKDEIKTIVTKEQFASMEYKVEEE